MMFAPTIAATLERMNRNDAINAAAQAAHEVNRAYCAGLGDDSQPAWDNAPDWQRSSAIAGVEAVAADPVMTAEAQHKCWLTAKAADGWKFGPVKDVDRREHPCFVPYADLPAAQQIKDTLFGATVRGILQARGVI